MVRPLKEAGLSGKVRIVAYDLTREIAGLVRSGDIYAASDTKGVSQARVAINTVVNFLEKRNTELPHSILIKLGLVSQDNYAGYDFDSSVAPDDYKPVLSYRPRDAK